MTDRQVDISDPMARQLVDAEIESGAEAIRRIPWCTPAMYANADHIARAVLAVFFDLTDHASHD